jgi:mannose-6-phosphate isomerase-like protein (cupin superfamily)
MKAAIGLICLLAFLVRCGGQEPKGSDRVPAEIQYVGHEKIQDLLAKGGPIIKDIGLLVAIVHRGAGEAEYHERTGHIFFMLDGEATLVVGGTLVAPKQVAPDQLRAPSIDGGTEYRLSKGDVIAIPAKTPHWIKEVSTNNATYYAVNVESR